MSLRSVALIGMMVAVFLGSTASARAQDLSDAAIAARDFMFANEKAPGIKATESGLQYRIEKSGDPSQPLIGPLDTVTAHYEGKLLNGKVFDSSFSRGEPITFQPARVIRGWTEALTMMRPGDVWTVYVPPRLGYGDRDMGDGTIPPNSVLIFKIEVLSVQK